MNLWEQAEQEFADTENPTPDESEATPTSDGSDNGSAGDDDASDYGDVTELARRVLDNPDTAVAELKRYKRHLDGQHGTDVSRLRQELHLTQAQVNAELARLKTEKSTPPQDSDEPDEFGLTPKDYERLGDVYEKTPQRRAEIERTALFTENLKDQRLEQVMAEVRKNYGDAFTQKRQDRVTRFIRRAGYDLSDPDVIAECTEVVEDMKAEIGSRQSRKIQAEGGIRSQAQQRVKASIERPSLGTVRSAEDISIADKNGVITPRSMAEAAKRIERLLK